MRVRALTVVLIALVGSSLLSPAPRLMAQGALEPSGPPGPTMVTLDQLHTTLVSVEAVLDEVQNAVVGVDFDELNTGVQGLTNALSGLDYFLATIITNQDYQMTYLTNHFAQFAWQTEALTNSLSFMDWSDVLEIKANVEIVTNMLASLDALVDYSEQLAGLTNVLGPLFSATNTLQQIRAQNEAMLMVLTHQQADLDALMDLEQINNDMLRMLTNALGVTNAFGVVD